MRTRDLAGAPLVLAVLLATTPVAPAGTAAAAVRAEDGRSGYVPQAGYRRTVRQLHLQRRLRARAPGAPGARTESLAGDRTLPVILVRYANTRQEPFPPARYGEDLFDTLGAAPEAGHQRTVTRFYSDMSLGQFRLYGSVLGWYGLPKDDTYYEGDAQGEVPELGDLLTSAFQQADADTDFGRFDNDGPDGLPNSGDDDGIVDVAIVVHPEAGAECKTTAARSNVWSHQYAYSASDFPFGTAFVTGDLRRDAGGRVRIGENAEPERIRIDDYLIVGGTSCDGTRPTEIGLVAHEVGHALGLPDLYDRTPQQSPDSHGIGEWDVMAGGSWGFAKAGQRHPTRLSAWSLFLLGWADVDVVDGPGPVSLEPVADRNRILRVNVPDTRNNEFFLIEHRDPGWRDPAGARINWDEKLPTAGLAIWHVDHRVGAGSTDWPFAALDRGQNDSPSLPGSLHHSLVSMRQADCQYQLERRQSEGDPADLVRAGETFPSRRDCPMAPRSYAGGEPLFGLRDVTVAEFRIEFPEERAARAAAPPAPAPEPVVNAAGAAAPAREAAPAGRARDQQLRSALTGKLRELELQAGGDLPVQLDASGTRVERIESLDLPARTEPQVVDAARQIAELELLIGPNRVLRAARAGETDRTGEHFQQLHPVEGRTLPIFGKGVTLHYDDSTVLRALENRTVDPGRMDVQGEPGALSFEAARARAVEQLGLPEGQAALLRSGGEGIYLLDGDPTRARMAYRLELPVTSEQPTLSIFVEQGGSQSILAIE